MRTILTLLLTLLGSHDLLRAHNEFLSFTRVWTEEHAWVIEVNLDPYVTETFYQGKTEDPFYQLNPEKLEPVREILSDRARTFYQVEARGYVLQPMSAPAIRVNGDNIYYTLRYPRQDETALTLTHRFLDEMVEGHRTVIEVLDADRRPGTVAIFSAHQRTLTVGVDPPAPDPSTPAGTEATATEATAAPATPGDELTASAPRPLRRSWFPPDFFLLGVEHIAFGFDHLLFLAALLVACLRVREILALATSFTLAHSITLAVAALDLWTPSARLVEAAIAASIVYVGVENLTRRKVGRGRIFLTFAFGLIHGFGFAGVLRGIGLGSDGQGLIGPLFAFNVGIEAGQLAIIALAMPLLLWVQQHEKAGRSVRLSLSSAVAVMGLIWFFQRAIL